MYYYFNLHVLLHVLLFNILLGQYNDMLERQKQDIKDLKTAESLKLPTNIPYNE